MKLKNVFLVAAAVSLTLTAAPLAVKAEKTAASVFIAQAQQNGPFQNLNLTAEQQARITEIRNQTRAKIEQILSPEQQQQFRAATQNGQGKRGGFRDLNLSEDQKNQIREIKRSSKQQIQEVLTDEQKQQLEQFRQQRRQNRQSQPNSSNS